jgi:hypothetical protein
MLEIYTVRCMVWVGDLARRNGALELNLGKLSSEALKSLSKAVDSERKRRGKRNPTNHEPPTWDIPRVAVKGIDGKKLEAA